MGQQGMGTGVQSQEQGQERQQAAFHYFETRTPQQVFLKTLDSLWMQATAIYGDDAEQLICDAVRSDDPTMYVKDHLPSFTLPDIAA